MKNIARASRLFKGYLLALVLLLLTPACSDVEDSIYHDYRCYFVFDTTLHAADCHLTVAMGNTGQFLIVRSSMVSGIRHILTTRNYDNATEDTPLTTEKEAQTTCLLGAGNAIIIGRSSYTGVLVAYEGQCPNCLNDHGGTNYPLAWSTNGQQLNCARCKRSYDVNNGVVAAGEGGRQLYAYNASFDGTLIRAWN